MKKLIEFFATQSLFGILLTIFAVVVGSVVLSFFIRREVFPNVSFDMVTVTTPFPGASADEAEKLITNVLEQELQEVDGIKKLESHSVQNRSLIVVQLDPDATTEEKMKSELRDVVDRVKPQLPETAEEPIIESQESKQRPIIEVGLFSEEMPPIEFRNLAKDLELELETIDGVAKVNTFGLEDVEIRVETSLDQLKRYDLSLEELTQALKSQNVSIPGGTIEASPSVSQRELAGSRQEMIVRTSGQFEKLEDVEKTVVRANELGRAVFVKDVASVSYALTKPTLINHTNGKRSIRLQVVKKEKGDAIKVTDAVKAKMDELRVSPLLSGKSVDFVYLNDLSFLIKRRLKILTTNLMVGLALVLVILALLLPVRVALIVSIGIPFSFFGTIILFDAWDYSINLISLIGLIIVSGMLVDDAIVIMDNCINHMERGKSPLRAAIDGTFEIWIPVTAAVLTTIVVFMPMMFMSGIFGKFVKEIPTGVILALLFSLIEAFFILPGHIAEWVRMKPEQKKKKKSVFLRYWENVIVPGYLNALRLVLRARYLVGGLALVSFLITAFVGFKLRLVLFPPDDVEIFFIRSQTETGTALEETERRFKPIERAIAKLPEEELKNFITTVGMHGQEGGEIPRRGSEYVQATIFLTPPNLRRRGDQEIIEQLRDEIGQPEGLGPVTFQRVNPGPPVGKPVSLGIRGDSYEAILPAVKRVQEMVAAQEGVTDVENTYILGKEEIRVNVDTTEAAAAGLTVAQIGSTVRAAFEGIIPTTVRTLDEEMDVRVSLSQTERATPETLGNLRIPNARGYRIPLSRVAKLDRTQGLADYAHEDNQRQIKVTAEVDTEKTSSQIVNTAFREKLPSLNREFPNVNVAFGGESKDTLESLISLGKSFVVALLGVLLLLVLTFRRLVQPLFLIVFVTIPMGVMSVIWAFILHGRPLTFMGFLGIIALSGVIVNNAIVFIDFVNRRREKGGDRWQTILDSAEARIRPIVLTTITTAVGLLPTTYGIGGLDKFVTYITMALSWGLLFGSLLTAFVLPAAIAILDDVYFFITGRVVAEPNPEEA